MLAAAAVSPFVEEVLIIDKENALSGAGSEEELRKEFAAAGANILERAKLRRGVPQYIQPHGLLCRATHSVELLLPGWKDLATGLGGRVTPPGRVKTFYRGDWTHHPMDTTGLITINGSRALIESSIRTRLMALHSNVHFHCGCWAAAPLWSADGSCMEGVETKGGQEFRADLVIDAAGRRSPVPGWLAAGGFAPPRQVEVDPHVTYTSRLYRTPRQDMKGKDWDAIYIRPTAPNTRGGLLQRIENDLLLCCVWGYSGDHPPHSEQGFQEFVASLERRDVYEAIKDTEPLTQPISYSQMTNLRRLYEDIPMPGGLAVVGDSLAGFNPVYGQGISVAAIEAETLQGLLQEKAKETHASKVTAADLASVAAPFQAMAKDIVDFPFSVSTGGDLDYEGTTGERPKKLLVEKLMSGYLEALIKLAADDITVFKAIQEVMNMMTTPESLLRPALIAKALHMRIARLLST
ncbi:hypothetical protein WJX75_009736 [Coccomyxa subellipsoidea]|uniref:FAD/NAD(P)-binding domain-containing protein n=1 Tax=Coccomyxa subellipsoidea TaxID=248742 RepID=A0ABR2YR95_9CHLO